MPTKVNPVVRTMPNWHATTSTPASATAYLLAKGMRFIVLADPVDIESEYLAKAEAFRAFHAGEVHKLASRWDKTEVESDSFIIVQAFFSKINEGYFTMISTDIPSSPADRLQKILMGFKREDTMLFFEPTHESARFITPVVHHADALLVTPGQIDQAYASTLAFARQRGIPLLAGGGSCDPALLNYYTLFEHAPTSIDDFFCMIRNHQCAPRVFGRTLGEEFEIEGTEDPFGKLFPAEPNGTAGQSPREEVDTEEDQGIHCPS